MNRFVMLLLVLFLARPLPTAHGAGEPPDLIIPLSKTEEISAQSTFQEEISRIQRFAVRYRIVKLDTNSIRNGADVIRITLFPEIELTLARTAFSSASASASDRTAWEWSGSFVGLPFDREQFRAEQQKYNPETNFADEIFDSRFVVEIAGTRFTFSGDGEKSRSDAALRYDSATRSWKKDVDTLTEKSASREKFDAISAKFSVPNFLLPNPQVIGTTDFSIRSLSLDRRYHVIYEIDRSRLSPPSEKPDSQLSEEFEDYINRVQSGGKSESSDTEAAQQ